MVCRETFLQIQLRPRQHLILKNWIHGVQAYQNRFTRQQRKRRRTKHQLRIRDASQDRQPEIQSSPVGDIFKELRGRPTKTAYFGSPLWQVAYASNLCLLEDKVQDRGMEMVHSVDDLKSSSSVRGFQMPNFEVFDARIASALNRIVHNSHFKRRVSLEEQKAQNQDRFGHWSQRLCRELCRPVHYWSSKRRYSGIRFKVGRNSMINDTDSTWWHLGRIVQIENTRVWKIQDCIGIVWPGDSSEDKRTWLSQIENYGEEKYWAGNSK